MSDTENLVDDLPNGEPIDTPDDTPIYSEITEEQALEWKKKAERLEKAEKALVEYKRKLKEVEPSSEPKDDVMTKAEYARMRFLEANPELNDYEKELGDYQKKGLSFEEAKVLILNSDKARQNREKLNSLGLSD